MGKFEEEMKVRINEELARVNRKITAIKAEARPEELEGFGDNTPLSEEGDVAQVGEERELRSDVLGKLLERAAALDEALHRIREGDYGVCVSCGRRIDERRLKAVPEAAYCVRCMAEREGVPSKEPRPTEWKETEKLYQVRDKQEGGFDRKRVRPELVGFEKVSGTAKRKSKPKS